MSVPEGIPLEIWTAFRSARLWHDAADADVEWLARCAEVREYRRGDIVFREGDPADQVAVIVQGHTRSSHTEEGRTSVLETHWPGDAVGAVAVLANIPFATDVEAAEALTVAMIPAGVLRQLIVGDPTVALSVINEISRRWVSAVAVNKRNCVDVVGRIAIYLSDLPKTRLGGPAYAVEIPISRAELAAELNTTPETLSRAFHTLQDQGVIESHDRMIIVPDGDALMSKLQPDHSASHVAH